MRHHRLVTMSLSAVLLVACRSGGAAQPPAGKAGSQATQPQATLPEKLCDLLPQTDAEKIMRKPLVQKRNDNSGCEYQDAVGTSGTGLMVFTNVLPVADQCRMTSGSEPLTGVGDEACIAVGIPAGRYTTTVFSGAGQTFEVIAPGEDRASEVSTALAKVILSKLGA